MEQREIWGGTVGDGWVRHAATIDAHSAPFGHAARAVLGDLSGAAVLDVGCGTGSTTVELAEAGAERAVGVDVSEPMIAYARRVHRRPSVRFVEGSATELPAGTGPFDAVYSRFGVMFFDQPEAAFAALRDQVVPGGRLGFCSWGGPFDNPWMTSAVLASIPVLGPPDLPGPGEPGPFSLSDPDHVRTLLDAAGWRDITVEVESRVAPHPAGGPDAVATVLVDNVPPLAMGLARAPGRAAELHGLIVEALSPFVVGDRVELPASALIVSAHR